MAELMSAQVFCAGKCLCQVSGLRGYLNEQKWKVLLGGDTYHKYGLVHPSLLGLHGQ